MPVRKSLTLQEASQNELVTAEKLPYPFPAIDHQIQSPFLYKTGHLSDPQVQ